MYLLHADLDGVEKLLLGDPKAAETWLKRVRWAYQTGGGGGMHGVWVGQIWHVGEGGGVKEVR